MNFQLLYSLCFILLSTLVQESTATTTVLSTEELIRKESLEVEKSYALITDPDIKDNELEILKEIAATANEVEYGNWKNIIKNEWLKVFLMYEAIEAQKFGFAFKICNDILTKDAEFETIQAIVKGNVEYPCILLFLEKSIHKMETFSISDRDDIFDLRRAILSKFYKTSLISLEISSNVSKDIDDGKDIELYPTLMKNLLNSELDYYSDKALISAIKNNRIGLIGILLLNHSKLNANNFTTSLGNLRKLNLYLNVKSPMAVKMLKDYGIPMFYNYESKALRESIHTQLNGNMSEPQIFEILNLIKFTLMTDMKFYYQAFENDCELTMEEALMTRNYYNVSLFLSKPGIVYKKEWMNLAIKFCGILCFDTLLRERVPMLTDKEFDDALSHFFDETVRQDFKNRWKRYSTFYDSNRKCIHGPLGFDAEKYKAIEDSQKKLREAIIVGDLKNVDAFIRNHLKLYKELTNSTFVSTDILVLTNSKFESNEILATSELYPCARSPEMVQLLKRLKFPLIFFSRNIRQIPLADIPESKRSEIINLLKLNFDGDKARYRDLYGGNDKMTMEDAIKTRDNQIISGIFLREDVGVYQKSWMNLAITNNCIKCFEILLVERVPLLTDTEFNAAITNFSVTTKQEFKDKLNAYKQYYKNNICIDGPLGCDEVKYNAWLKSKNSPKTRPRKTGSGAAVSNARPTSPLVATHESECTPFVESQYILYD